MFFENLQRYIPLIASVIGITVAVSTAFIKLKSWIGKRIHVKRILDSSDDNFLEVCRLHERLFSDAVGDDAGDLQRWLDEAKLARTEKRFDDILLALLSGDRAVGYMYAQYYFSSQLIFISYLAIDEEVREIRQHHTGVVTMLSYLIKYAKKQRYNWQGIVAEVEEFKHGPNGSLEPKAKKLMVAFQQSLRLLCKRFNLSCDLYRICIDYKQPILRPEDIEIQKPEAPDHNQWLLYIPRTHSQVIRDRNATFVSRSTVHNVLRLIFLETYSDAFPEDNKYSGYLHSQFEQYCKGLQEHIPVTKNWREAQRPKLLISQGLSGKLCLQP